MKHLGRDFEAALRARRNLTLMIWRLGIAESRRNCQMWRNDPASLPKQDKVSDPPAVKSFGLDGAHEGGNMPHE